MGKKRRELRRERREDFASKRTHQKRKSNLLAGGILGLIAVIVGFSIYTFIGKDFTPAKINQVSIDSPAEKAGLQKNDIIVGSKDELLKKDNDIRESVATLRKKIL